MSSAQPINDSKPSDTSIVFLNPVGAIGGAERALLTMIAALRTAQPNLQLHLIVGTDGPLVEMAQNIGVKVKLLKLPDQLNQLGDSSLKNNSQPIQKTPGKSKIENYLTLLLKVATALPSVAQYLGEFRQAIREINPDLIHSNGIKTHLLTALAGSMGVPVVWHIHDFYGSRPLMAKVLRWMSDRATFGIAISQAVAQDAKATLPRLPIEVIYNSVDTNYFSPVLQERLTEQYCSPSDSLARSSNPIRVGLVATFARWKGHDVFLQASARVIRNCPNLNVRFYIVGGAIYQTKGSQFSEQELQELAATLQIENDVEFLGFQSDIAEVYRWLDIVVHASTQPEPFGLAIVEAMACGKPVIVSQAGGAAELFTHDYDAVGIAPGDFEALALAIAYLIDNPDQRQHLSENARTTVLKQFSSERLGKQLLSAYQRINVFDE